MQRTVSATIDHYAASELWRSRCETVAAHTEQSCIFSCCSLHLLWRLLDRNSQCCVCHCWITSSISSWPHHNNADLPQPSDYDNRVSLTTRLSWYNVWTQTHGLRATAHPKSHGLWATESPGFWATESHGLRAIAFPESLRWHRACRSMSAQDGSKQGTVFRWEGCGVFQWYGRLVHGLYSRTVSVSRTSMCVC